MYRKKLENNNYHLRLKRMIDKVKKETGWRYIFKIVKEAQRRIK